MHPLLSDLIIEPFPIRIFKKNYTDKINQRLGYLINVIISNPLIAMRLDRSVQIRKYKRVNVIIEIIFSLKLSEKKDVRSRDQDSSNCIVRLWIDLSIDSISYSISRWSKARNAGRIYAKAFLRQFVNYSRCNHVRVCVCVCVSPMHACVSVNYFRPGGHRILFRSCTPSVYFGSGTSVTALLRHRRCCCCSAA